MSQVHDGHEDAYMTFATFEHVLNAATHLRTADHTKWGPLPKRANLQVPVTYNCPACKTTYSSFLENRPLTCAYKRGRNNVWKLLIRNIAGVRNCKKVNRVKKAKKCKKA